MRGAVHWRKALLKVEIVFNRSGLVCSSLITRAVANLQIGSSLLITSVRYPCEYLVFLVGRSMEVLPGDDQVSKKPKLQANLLPVAALVVIGM